MATKTKTINFAGNDVVVNSIIVGKTTPAKGNLPFSNANTGRGFVQKAAPAPATATNTATLTTAQIMNGIIVGTPTAAAAYTLPLAANLAAALPSGFAIDDGCEFSVINVATGDTFAITMTTNTGWTLVGGMVVQENENSAHNSAGRFLARKTAAATFTLYRLSA